MKHDLDWTKFVGGSNIRVRKILDFVTSQNIYDPDFFDRPSRFSEILSYLLSLNLD
jgi:hypothetical protein